MRHCAILFLFLLVLPFAAQAEEKPFEIKSEWVSTGRNFPNRLKYWVTSNVDYAICVRFVTKEAKNVEGGPLDEITRIAPGDKDKLFAEYDRIDPEFEAQVALEIADLKICD